MPRASLLVIRGVHQGRRFELDDDDASLGRGTRNRFRILDTEISRNHVVIRFEDDAYVLTDRNSSNGTFVNGLSVSSHRLSSGDQIQLGCTALLFSESTGSKLAVPVDIVSPPEEHSQIVSRIDGDAGRQLLQASVSAPEKFASTPQGSLRLLYQISEELVSTSLSIEELFQRILDTTLESVHADRGCMLVADPQTGELLPRAVAHAEDNTEPERMPVSRSIVDYVLKKREGVRTSDARSDSRFASGQSIMTGGICEAMCVPMPGRYELMGVLYVDTTTAVDHVTNTDKFTDEHLNLLAAIGRQSALAVEDHRFQESLVKAERLAAVGQTIAMLSHHVKNILQGVRGGSYLIDMGLKGHDEEMIQQGWGVVEKNQDRIYQLMMDMLTFSTERQPKLESGNVNELAQDVYELMEARAAELNIALRLNLGKDIPSAMFDAEGIHRAILNIVINALDAVAEQEHAVVEIRTGSSDDDSDVWVEVADNGPGIPEEHVDSIFNLFESTKGGRGTGIGLAVSQKIIHEHGGEVLIDNQPNVGCRFRLLWPSLEDENRSSGRRTARGAVPDIDEGFTEDSQR